MRNDLHFLYTASDKDGATVHGTIEATNRELAVKNLQKQGLRPLVLKRMTHKKFSFGSRRKKKVKLKDLVVFTRQLSTMVSAGVPLNKSILTLQNQAENEYFKQVIAAIGKDVQAGNPLGDSFAKYPNIFSDVYVNMVKAGEAGGILDEILKRLASQVEQESSMKKKIKSAMTYPVVILSITIIAFFGIMIFVIPKIGKIMLDLGGPDAELPIYTRAMLAVSSFMQSYAIFIIIGMVAFVWLLRRYLRTPGGKYKFHALLLRLPVIKVIITKVAVARFSRTFASLMSAGVGVLDALEVTGGAIGNKVIEAELAEAAKQVKNGRPLSEPLSQSKHFPPIVGQMLAVGEETGQIDKVLVKVADFYEEEVTATIDALSSLIEPIMIIVLGSIVGLIAASVMGPIANLSKNVSN
ncbi:MAG: type pilus assembly protein PilC [Patescibacteria group bacterium]|nr:type pilus assembly protein PilC [Patescibacteria group bacterium]